MGLDMYASVRVKGESEGEQISSWRKHNALHGLMEDIYREKGGIEEFNCVELVLNAKDIDRIEKALTERTASPTGGFFFGETENYDQVWGYNKEADAEFIAKAREAHEKGLEVYYDSWW